MENLEQFVDFGFKFVALPSAVIGLVMMVVRFRKELPFVGTTEAQQLEAARALKLSASSDGPDALHPYEKGLLYRMLAKSRFVSIREVDRALQLPDPYEHVRRLMSTRRFFDNEEAQGEPVFRFVPRYRVGWRRRIAKRVVEVAYYAFALLALAPVIAAAGYYQWYVPDVVPAEQFSEVAAYLYRLLAMSLPLFGILAVCCLLWIARMHRAERLVAAERALMAATDAATP